MLWLAARARLPAWSPLRRARPLPIAAVVSSGGLQDLELVHEQQICGAETIEALIGYPTGPRIHLYADTSPAELGVGRDREVLISGAEDTLAPPALAAAYLAKMRPKGAKIEASVVSGAGHVELISPGTPAWDATVKVIQRLIAEQ